MGTSGMKCVESCVSCHLRSRSFFCDLSPDSIADFDKIKHAALFPEHAVALVEGQSAWGIFVLCQGRAKLSTTSREGKTLIIRIAEAGEVLGLHAVVSGSPLSADSRNHATLPTRLCRAGRHAALSRRRRRCELPRHTASGARLF